MRGLGVGGGGGLLRKRSRGDEDAPSDTRSKLKWVCVCTCDERGHPRQRSCLANQEPRSQSSVRVRACASDSLGVPFSSRKGAFCNCSSFKFKNLYCPQGEIDLVQQERRFITLQVSSAHRIATGPETSMRSKCSTKNTRAHILLTNTSRTVPKIRV